MNDSRPIRDRPLGNYGALTPLNAPFLQQCHYEAFLLTDNAYCAMPQTDSQRQEGLPFKETHIIHQPLNTKGNHLRPDIVANIQKGFFQDHGKWTCHRRNYFSVNCSFTLSPSSEGQLYLKQDHDTDPEPIQHFAVLISAKTSTANNQDGEARDLVQHTAKRSKSTKSTPIRQIVVPSNFTFGSPNYPDLQPASAPSSCMFDRIQFAKATANNGKGTQQCFHVVVGLWACINRRHGKEWILAATRDSDQVVVRGRSLGHYKDKNDKNRRDSQSNMGLDRLSGPASDESTAAHHFGSQSLMNWHCLPIDGSGPSILSSTTYTDSSHSLAFHHPDTGFTPPSPDSDEAFSALVQP